MTAYDLVRYRKGAGSIDHVATVLAELAERLDPKRLLAIARAPRLFSAGMPVG